MLLRSPPNEKAGEMSIEWKKLFGLDEYRIVARVIIDHHANGDISLVCKSNPKKSLKQLFEMLDHARDEMRSSFPQLDDGKRLLIPNRDTQFTSRKNYTMDCSTGNFHATGSDFSK